MKLRKAKDCETVYEQHGTYKKTYYFEKYQFIATDLRYALMKNNSSVHMQKIFRPASKGVLYIQNIEHSDRNLGTLAIKYISN